MTDLRAELALLATTDPGQDIGAWAELAGRYKALSFVALAALDAAEQRYQGLSDDFDQAQLIRHAAEARADAAEQERDEAKSQVVAAVEALESEHTVHDEGIPCAHVFAGTKNVCRAGPDHPVHHGDWHRPSGLIPTRNPEEDHDYQPEPCHVCEVLANLASKDADHE
jgi:Tfp pilus assembly protein PilX